MTTVWTYPWVLAECGLEEELEQLSEMGVDGISVATRYHSIQTIAPRTSGSRVHEYSGGCFFSPDSGEFENADIRPLQNRISTLEEPLEAVCEAAKAAGLDVAAWTVCNHNSRLGANYPDYQIQSAYGQAHEHALCPSWPPVQDFLSSLITSIASYDIDRIDLESLGFPSALHGHGSSFGHSKNHVITSPTEDLLFSQCFCSGCSQRARDHHVALDKARSRVQGLLDQSMQSSQRTLPSLANLIEEYPEIDALFAFRRSVISDLLEEMAIASGSTPLNYYVADGVGRGATDGRPAGIQLDQMASSLEAVTALCYTDDVETARERTKEIREYFGGTTHGAISLSPEVTGSKQTVDEVANAVRNTADGELYIYNHSLLGADQLDWVADLAASPSHRT